MDLNHYIRYCFIKRLPYNDLLLTDEGILKYPLSMNTIQLIASLELLKNNLAYCLLR